MNFPISIFTPPPSLTGTTDAFVARVVPSGLAWVGGWSTYFGSPVATNEHGYGIAVDKQGNIIVGGKGDAGTATLPVGPLVGTTGYQADYGGGASDAFLAKFNGGTGAVVWGTWIGGLESDEGKDVAVDQVGTNGNPYLTGWTNSRNFPVSYGAFQTNRLGNDAFVVKMNPTGTAIGKRQQEPIAEQQVNAMPDRGIGLTGAEKGVSVRVFPNPSHDNVRISFRLEQRLNVQVEICTLSGSVVLIVPEQAYAAGDHEVVLATGTLPSSTYLIRLSGAGESTARLLTIVR